MIKKLLQVGLWGVFMPVMAASAPLFNHSPLYFADTVVSSLAEDVISVLTHQPLSVVRERLNPVVIPHKAPPPLAETSHTSSIPDQAEEEWLPDLTGLPSIAEVLSMEPKMLAIMQAEADPQCIAIPLNLRMMIFQHFLIYQHMLNAQNIYFDEQIPHQWAHVLAMILQESSGDSTDITEMSGRSFATYGSLTDLQHWRRIFSLTTQGAMAINYQTNFGLTQTSADRLFVAFDLANDQKAETVFLEGREGAATPKQTVLNTASAIRRLILFYQGFAQGRFVESAYPIAQQDIYKPEFFTRYQEGLTMALFYCGTRFMFRGGYLQTGDRANLPLHEAMASIAYCKLGNARQGYGQNEMDEKCYAAWATLCPALNIDIATLTPLSYFATRNARPVCEATFQKLWNKNPSS